jgi:hypothetical protein
MGDRCGERHLSSLSVDNIFVQLEDEGRIEQPAGTATPVKEPAPSRHPSPRQHAASAYAFVVPLSHQSDPIPFRLLIQLHPAVIIPSNVDPDHVHNDTCFFLNERVMSNPDSEYSFMPDHQVSVSAPTGSRRLRQHASELCTNLRRLSQWILVNTVHLQYSHQIHHQYCWYCSATARSSRAPMSEHVFRSSPPELHVM